MSDKLILKGLPKGYYTEESVLYVAEDQLQKALDIEPAKIVKGHSIAGVSGIMSPEGGVDTSDADATVDDILANKTAYVNNEKIVGNIPIQGAETAGTSWSFITETVDSGQSPSYGRAMFISIPKGAYMEEFSDEDWTGPATPVVRVPCQSSTVTPSEYQQSVSTTTRRVIEKVTINPIPETYKNTNGTTAAAEDILNGKIAVTSEGKITGTIPDRNQVDPEIGGISTDQSDVAVHMGTSPQFIIPTVTNEMTFAIAPPRGYYQGNSFVGVLGQDKTVNPSLVSQVISADSGKVLRNVTVNTIPNDYHQYKSVTPINFEGFYSYSQDSFETTSIPTELTAMLDDISNNGSELSYIHIRFEPEDAGENKAVDFMYYGIYQQLKGSSVNRFSSRILMLPNDCVWSIYFWEDSKRFSLIRQDIEYDATTDYYINFNIVGYSL